LFSHVFIYLLFSIRIFCFRIAKTPNIMLTAQDKVILSVLSSD